MGMESPIMHFSSRCKNCTGLYWTGNYPVLCCVVKGRRWKFTENVDCPSPWYRVCTKAMIVSKGIYGYGQSKNVVI